MLVMGAHDTAAPPPDPAWASAGRCPSETLDATVLTYRESRTLDHAGRDRIKELEVQTSAPLRSAIEAGFPAGLISDIDIDSSSST